MANRVENKIKIKHRETRKKPTIICSCKKALTLQSNNGKSDRVKCYGKKQPHSHAHSYAHSQKY